MIEQRYRDPLLRYSVLLFCLVWILYMMKHAEVPADVGDGIAHFFISQASWSDPSLFLHHWGKPFYILLSSPFAQFGFNGLVVFNALVFAATILIGYRIMHQKNINVWLQILFPLIMLKAHDVANTILGGLTEPLFNLASILALYFLLNKRFAWFALIVSLMPFMRSEGQLPLILALVILVFNRSYKNIPILFSAFIIYSIIGIFAYGDFWWYFTESPYSLSNSIYGQGSWAHYLISYKNYLGNPGLYILMLGIPAMIMLIFQRKLEKFQLDWWIFAYGTFIGVVFSHSCFYATGSNGSYGLTRIATQGMPIFLLLHLYYIGQFRFFSNKFVLAFFGVFSLGLITALSTTKYYPKKANSLDEQILHAADFIGKMKNKKVAIFFYSPLFCYSLGENNYMPGSRMKFFTFSDLSDNLKVHFRPGDLILRDSHFGPLEMNLQLNELAKHPELVKIKEFISSEQLEDPLGETEGVRIYQYLPKKEIN